jgi:FkbM family methyltransferase
LGQESYQKEEDFFRRYLQPGDVVIDAGANVGVFTLMFSVLVGREGRVYAVEPHPRICRYLQGNLTLNGTRNVSVFNVALGETDGEARLSDYLKDDDVNTVTADIRGIQVPIRRLDDLGIAEKSISLLKVDVEGYEKYAIEGARGILENVRCIYFEAVESNCAKFGYGPGELIGKLKGLGYHMFELCGDDVREVKLGERTGDYEDLAAVREPADFLNRAGFRGGTVKAANNF